MKHMNARIVARMLTAALAAAALVFVGLAVQRALESGFDLAQVRWRWFIAAFGTHLLVLLLLPLLWAWVLGGVTGVARADRHPLLALYLACSRSWLGRYLPGRVWAFGGRAYLARRPGVSTAALGSSLLLEALFSYGALTVLGLALLTGALVHPAAGVGLGLLGILTLANTLPLLRRTLQAGNGVADRIAKPVKRPIGALVSAMAVLRRRQSAEWVAAYTLHSSLQVMFYIFLAMSLMDLTPAQLVATAGACVLGGVAGYLAVFTPAGLGVREGATMLMLSQIISAPEAAVTVAAARLALVASDIAFVALMEAIAFTWRSSGHLKPCAVAVPVQPEPSIPGE